MQSYLVPHLKELKGLRSVRLPGSKSITNRALVLAALSQGETTLENFLLADDPLYMYQALEQLGYKVSLDRENRICRITGGSLPAKDERLFVGNAGTAMRFLSTLLCLGKGNFYLDGDSRMRERPIADLIRALSDLGCDIRSETGNGCPPLIINAQGIQGGECALPGKNSSQYISSLLLAAPCMQKGLSIKIQGEMASRPYIDMTQGMMRVFGADSSHRDYQDFQILPATYSSPGKYHIEPDASAASYFLSAAAVLGGEVCIEGLGSDSVQGDTGFARVLESMGCRLEWEEKKLILRSQGKLQGINIDMNHIPDMVLSLAVVALFAEGPTTIRNVPNLRIKETDRITALCNELSKLGARVEEYPDGLCIHPAPFYHAASIATYNDHRMAMSFSIAGLRIPGVQIEDPGCVSKTFPDFFQVFESFLMA